MKTCIFRGKCQAITITKHVINLYATEQKDDQIVFKNCLCDLEVNFQIKSPLESYINPDYKFEMVGSNNYRGYIAKWEIRDEELRLISINVNGSNIELSDYFSEEKTIRNTVLADWYTGFIMIKKEQFKDWFESPHSVDKMYVTKYKEMIILKIQQGIVQDEKVFSYEDYKKYLNIIESYNEIPEKEYLCEFINDFDEFIYLKNDEKELQNNINDSELFLDRYISRKVSIPITKYLIIENATIDSNKYKSIFSTFEQSIKISHDNYILIIEMNPNEIPEGYYKDYTSGSVSIICNIDNTTDKRFNLTDLDEDDLFWGNNWAEYNSSKSIDGIIEIHNIGNKVRINGEITLLTADPIQNQRIKINEIEFPVYSIREYLEKESEKDWNLLLPMDDVEEIMKEIELQSNEN